VPNTEAADHDGTGVAPGALRIGCYLDADSPGGSSVALRTLVGALDPSFEITVMGPSETMVRYAASARPGAAIRVLDPVRSKFDLGAIRGHVRAVRDLRPDILHVNLDNPWTAQYGLLAGVVTRTPIVSVLHLPTPPWRWPQAWLVRPVARRITAYVCVSAQAARFAESVLHMAPGTARVIYNGMPVPGVLAPPAPPGPPGALRIGAVGRLADQKALHVLITAVASLPTCRLVLVGDGPERPRLEALVRTLSIEDRVEFAGWTEPPWTATWSFDVLAMSSANEGFPLVIVEAMLAGIPVVATSVGGIPEVVVPESTGLLVPPDDPGAMADALGRLAADPALRHDMAARGRALAHEQFTDTAMAAHFAELYRGVAVGH
jgi:glycosyltransferase involved in cell wall biosynthesis